MYRSRNKEWIFILPSALLLSAVLLFPLSYTLYISFFDYNLNNSSHQFIGFENYRELLGEARVWGALGKTILIVFSAVLIEIVLGLLVAYALYNLTRGANAFSIMLFLPHIITPVVAAVFLRWVFLGQFGLISSVMAGFDLQAPDFLGSPGWAQLTVILADVWQFTPLATLILYASMTGIDESQIEAARIDGAGAMPLLFYIVIPSIAPMIFFVAIVRLIDGFRSFDAIYVLTAGGPGTATETVTMYTYSLAFKLLEMGKASALGTLGLILLVCLTLGLVAAIRLLKGSRI